MPDETFRSVKIKRATFIDRIKNKTAADWITVSERLGLTVRTDCGRGSHAVAYRPDKPITDRDACILTITRHTHQHLQREHFKKLLAYGINTGSYTEDDIWRALDIRV